MNMVTPTTEEEGRQQAIEWQAWQADQDLSIGELVEWQQHFEIVAQQFNLTEEFRENGII